MSVRFCTAGVPGGSYDRKFANGKSCGRGGKFCARWFSCAPAEIVVLADICGRKSRQGRQRYEPTRTAALALVRFSMRVARGHRRLAS